MNYYITNQRGEIATHIEEAECGNKMWYVKFNHDPKKFCIDFCPVDVTAKDEILKENPTYIAYPVNSVKCQPPSNDDVDNYDYPAYGCGGY